MKDEGVWLQCLFPLSLSLFTLFSQSLSLRPAQRGVGARLSFFAQGHFARLCLHMTDTGGVSDDV